MQLIWSICVGYWFTIHHMIFEEPIFLKVNDNSVYIIDTTCSINDCLESIDLLIIIQ
jgi:hypothetical protein